MKVESVNFQIRPTSAFSDRTNGINVTPRCRNNNAESN